MYNLDTFIAHENLGRSFRNKFQVDIITGSDRFIPLRAQSVTLDNFQLSGDYLESIKRYTVTGFTIPKTLTISALEMIDFSTYSYLLRWLGDFYDFRNNTFKVGSDGDDATTGRRRSLIIRADKPEGVSQYPMELRMTGVPLYIPNPSFDWKDTNPITLDSITLGIDSISISIQGVDLTK